MQKFFENVFYGVGINDVIDILIVAFVIYKLLGLIKQTRAEQLMKGVVLLVIATFLSGLLNLHTINWLLKGTVALGAVAILVVFQPELRRALEYMGRSKMHDGAVIIRDGRVYAAGCVLPLTRNNTISKELGTRHRAGIGITENSDALTIIVSEETGIISMASEGQLSRFLDIKTVEKTLLNMYLNTGEITGTMAVIPKFFNKIRGKNNAK